MGSSSLICSVKRFAVLLCAEDSEYVKKTYGGYFGVFKNMLAEEEVDEQWDLYRVVAGEFPSDGDIGFYDGFVITGSCNDAHGDDGWICDLIDLVKKLHFLKKKILGICFGHQILGRAIGGKVGRAESWDIGMRSVYLSSTTLNVPMSSLSIIECHRDEVKELPPKAEVIGYSSKTGIEMFRYENHIMGIQGHPEYTTDILLNLIDRLLHRSFITKDYAEELKGITVRASKPDSEAWKRFCISFLKEDGHLSSSCLAS